MILGAESCRRDQNTAPIRSVLTVTHTSKEKQRNSKRPNTQKHKHAQHAVKGTDESNKKLLLEFLRLTSLAHCGKRVVQWRYGAPAFSPLLAERCCMCLSQHRRALQQHVGSNMVHRLSIPSIVTALQHNDSITRHIDSITQHGKASHSIATSSHIMHHPLYVM
jgi:hypothetical protein